MALGKGILQKEHVMESRSKKSARNILSGVICKLLLMIMAFITKTIFIRLLGVEYNGINGLYSNILSILALSELGVGNVLTFTLYNALKNNDQLKVCSLVYYFKKIYSIIAAVILVIGITLVPLLNYIVNSSISQNEVVLYYLLYLLNSSVSYIAVYKTTVIIADQNGYISNVCDAVITFMMYGAQIIYLLVFHDFLGYLIIQLICTIGKNFLLSKIADRLYPYLKEMKPNKNLVEKNQIFTNIKATFLYKISGVILNNTDNILISIIVGTVYVGHYSNYYMILSYIVALIGIFITGFMASLGNLNAENNMESSYVIFNILLLIFSFIGAIIACCFINCMQSFVALWLGNKNIMPFTWVIVIVFNIYLEEIMNPVWIFRETMGLFQQVKYLMLITAGLNLVLSIVFGNWWGVPGILLATSISKLLSQYLYEPRLLFKEKFKCNSVKNFFAFQSKQVIVCLIAIMLSYILCGFIGTGLLGLIFRAIISCIIAVVCVLLFNFNSTAWKNLYAKYIRPYLKKIKR